MKRHPQVAEATLFATCLFFCASVVFAQTNFDASATPSTTAGSSTSVSGSVVETFLQKAGDKEQIYGTSTASYGGNFNEHNSRDNSGGDSNRGDTGDQHIAALTSKEAIQLVASRFASSTIVAPDAAAPRILQGSATTESNSQPVMQGAQLIESLRHASEAGAAPTTIQNIVQTITEHASTSGAIRDFVKTVVQAAAPTSSLPLQTLPPQLPIRNEGGHGATATTGTREGEGGAPASSTSLATTSGGEGQVTHVEQVQALQDIGKNIHAITSAKQEVVKQIADAVAQTVDTSVNEVAKQDAIQAQITPQGFNAAQREQRLQEIKQQATQQGAEIAQQVTQSVLQGAVQPQQVDPVLKSSLQDIAQLVQAESGVSVSAPLGDRAVTTQIQSAAQNIAQNQDALAQRGGLDLYKDSDHDGISDYDEVHIYHTDPYNAYTGGGDLTDGERVLLGLDPHVAAIKPVPVQNPQSAGVETNTVFEVSTIALVGTSSPAQATTSAPAAPAATTSAPAPQPLAPATSTPQIRFSGRALPNSFVTLYIFSEPVVVTVKTDANGAWTYTLDTSLPDGQHQLYVATVDDQGNILAKSPPVPFTKTAEALSYTPLTIQEPTGPSPLDTLREHFIVTAGVLLALFVLIGILTLGFRGSTPTPVA